jgi:hypothetical protein
MGTSSVTRYTRYTGASLAIRPHSAAD